ncbi:armadillo-type protein [Gilbertella persicaria]|uniref:armadillo-type protein n=1 Tax=Gilbertella persicaria TaxID=101096 RepID=UPI0022200B71|nr:armadillo-type protein [Gilbertella persicaria]KAI8083963.1 armadillo-type protein [Gilbertella persicaria]
MSQGTNAYMVANLLEKMSNEDRDFRYMALNDLMNELQKESFQMETMIESKVVKAVLQLMDDKNSEVQNLAVKCLGPLVKQINENHLLQIIDCLCQYASQQTNEELRGIASIGLKAVVMEVDVTKGHQVSERIIPHLLATMEKSDASYEMQMDTLDALSEMLSRFGSQISVAQQTKIQAALLPLLSYNRAAVRKRVTIAIGYLVVHTHDELFSQLYGYLVEGLRTNTVNEKTRTLVQCAGVLSRSSATRIGKHLTELVPIIIDYTLKADDDDELREICLQTLESFILRCPTEMTSSVQDIMSLCLNYIKYDPNFVEEDDNEENEDNEDMDLEEDDDFDDEQDDFDDDDDDMSWKVRRSASKVLSAIIETRSDLLDQLYETVAPVLILRFKEREESVRVDILTTFIALLRQTNVYAEDTNHSEGPRQLLRAQVPKLCRSLAKQLTPKSPQTRQIGFHLLREIIVVLHGGLEEQMDLFVSPIESSLITTATDQQQSSSNLKIEILYFLRLFFHHHPADHVRSFIPRLAPAVIQSVSDKFYKISSEAFLVCIELIKVIRPIVPEMGASQAQPDHTAYLFEIYHVTMRVLSTSDADQEVKERSIMCLGALLAQVGDVLQAQQREAWDVLLERLRNEVTRLISVRTLTYVSRSPVAAGPELQRCILLAIDDIALLLRKSNRPLRIASLECLTVLIDQFGSQLRHEHFVTLLVELKPLVTDNDLHLLPLALKTVESMLTVRPDTVEQVKMHIVPLLFRLIESPLLQGSALNSLLSMLTAFVKASPEDYASLVKGLVDPLLHVKTSGVSAGGVAAVANKQAASTVAQCVAVLAAHIDSSHRDPTLREFQSYLQQPATNDSIKYLSLLTLGEIGRRIRLDQMASDVLALFSAQSEEVKFAAAFALGNICVGNMQTYLPSILDQIRQEPKRRYLLLHALKEIITRYDTAHDNTLAGAADKVWQLLLSSSEGDQEEGTRTVVAECLGKLALTHPTKFLPQLQDRLNSPSAHVRATVATAIKYAVVDPSVAYDELLKPIMVQFLTLLQDTDLNVKRLALLTVNSAVHRKPYLIRDILSPLIPLLYAETVVKEELIHTVEMGPFKHKVDDGLEIRKAAYECMYTLLSTCLDKIDVYGFLDHICVGLDDQHDIKMLAYLMLIRLSKVTPTVVAQRLDDLVTPFKATLEFKMRSNAVKQEVEKNQELIRAVLRCIVALHPLADPTIAPRFDHLELEVSTGPLAEEFKLAVTEAESRENRVDLMDLSHH